MPQAVHFFIEAIPDDAAFPDGKGRLVTDGGGNVPADIVQRVQLGGQSEELMLDVFAYLFTKKPRIRDGGFKAYLYKAARHMALRHKSKRKPLFSLDELTGEPDGQLLAVEVIRTEERNRILHFCMDEMNPDYREVLYLTYFEDMSYAQAAEVTGKTVKQITNMVYRGKKSLRRLLEREGITDAES